MTFMMQLIFTGLAVVGGFALNALAESSVRTYGEARGVLSDHQDMLARMLRYSTTVIAVIALAALAGVLLAAWLLPFPLVYVPFMGLVLFRIFYAKSGGAAPLLITWLMIALLVIPLVTMLSSQVANIAALGIVGGAAVTIALVWVTYLFFPDPPELSAAAAEAEAPAPPPLPRPPSRRSVPESPPCPRFPRP